MIAFSTRWMHWILIAITIMAWATVVTHDFSPVDDVMTISQNPKLNPPRFAADSIYWYWTHPYMGLYVPVTYTAWGLLAKATWVSTPDEHGLFLDAHIFHAASLLAHVMSALAVYRILRLILERAALHNSLPPSSGTPGEGRGGGRRGGRTANKISDDPISFPDDRMRESFASAAGALLFSLHPLQVEAVAWASGLKDVMCGAFSLAAVWLYLQSRAMQNSPAENRTPESARLYRWGAASLLVAMLCKPSAMVTPLVAAILDYFICRRSVARVARSIAPWLLVVVPLAIVAKVVQPGTGVPTAPIYERPILAGASLAFYLGKLIWPFQLTFDYAWQPLPMLQKKWFWAIAIIPAMLGIVGWIFRRRASWLNAAGCVSIAALLPVLGFVPFTYQNYSTVADHYAYLAMLGPAMALAILLSRVTTAHWPRAALAISILLVILASLMVAQLRYWQDEQSLLRRMITIKPDSLAGHNGLGKQYEIRHDFVNAEREYQFALSVDAAYLPARENLVKIWRATGRAEEAIEQVHILMKLVTARTDTNPNVYKEAFFQLGQLSMTQGLFTDAARLFQEDLKLNPGHAEAETGLKNALKMANASTQPGSRP